MLCPSRESKRNGRERRKGVINKAVDGGGGKREPVTFAPIILTTLVGRRQLVCLSERGRGLCLGGDRTLSSSCSDVVLRHGCLSEWRPTQTLLQSQQGQCTDSLVTPGPLQPTDFSFFLDDTSRRHKAFIYFSADD